MDNKLLLSATSPDQNPTSGYALSEISRATLNSYPACSQLEEFIIQRIQKENPYVKYKCLLIIKHVCRSGRPDFKKNITRNSDLVKKCLQYRGVPDLMHGDNMNKRVRETAKETLDAIFDDQTPISTTAVAASNRIQGLGNANNDILNNKGVYNQKVATSSIGSDDGCYHNRLPDNDTVTNTNNGGYGNNGNNGNYGNSGKNGSMTYSSSSSGSRGDREYDSSRPKYSNDNNSSTSHSMVGIGNPNFNTNADRTWMQIAREKASTVGANVSAGAIGLSNGTSNPTKWLASISTQRYKQSADDGKGSNLIPQMGGSRPYSDNEQYTTQSSGNNGNNGYNGNSGNSGYNGNSGNSGYNGNSGNSGYGDSYSNTYVQSSTPAYTAYAPNTPSFSSSSSSSSSSSAFVKPSSANMITMNNRQADLNNIPESYGVPGKTSVYGSNTGPLGGQLKPMVSGVGKAGAAASDGEYERALVTSLCEPGGLKAVPTEAALTVFLQKAVSLPANLIGDSLVEQFNSDHWQSRNKALSIVESFCYGIGQSGDVCGGLDEHVAWWRTVQSMCTLQSMTSDSKASVRSQALKTLNAIVLYKSKSTTPTSSSLSSSPSFSVTANYTGSTANYNGSTGGSAVDNGYTNSQPPSLLDTDSYSPTPGVDVEVEVEDMTSVSLINVEDPEPLIPDLNFNQLQRNTSLLNQPLPYFQNNTAQHSDDYLQKEKERNEIALLLDMDDGHNERKNTNNNTNNNNTNVTNNNNNMTNNSKNNSFSNNTNNNNTVQNIQNNNVVEMPLLFGQMTLNNHQNNTNSNNTNNSQNSQIAYTDTKPVLNDNYGILDFSDSTNNNQKSLSRNIEMKNSENDMFAGLNISSKPLIENQLLQHSSLPLSTPTSTPISTSTSTFMPPNSNPLPSFSSNLNPTDNFAFLPSIPTPSQSQSLSQSVSQGTGFGLTPLNYTNTPQHTTPSLTNNTAPKFSNTNSKINTNINANINANINPNINTNINTNINNNTTGLNQNNNKPLPFFLQSNNPNPNMTVFTNSNNGINQVQDPLQSSTLYKSNMNAFTNISNSGLNNGNSGLNIVNLGLNNGNSGLNNVNLGLNNVNLGLNNVNLGLNNQYFTQQNVQQNQLGDDRLQYRNPLPENNNSYRIPGIINTIKTSRDSQNAAATSTSSTPTSSSNISSSSTSFSTSSSSSSAISSALSSTSISSLPALKDDSFSFLSDVLKNPNPVQVPNTRK